MSEEKPKFFTSQSIEVHEWSDGWPKYEVILGQRTVLLNTPDLALANALGRVFAQFAHDGYPHDSAVRAITEGLLALGNMTWLIAQVLDRAAEREQAQALLEIDDQTRRAHALAASELRSVRDRIGGRF